MHPAPSIILFSVLSGIGFGILALFMMNPNVVMLGHPISPFWPLFVGYGFAVSGLLASSFHLANKKNAIKAFRQVRTSWLSREAWVSVIALVLGGIYGLWLLMGNEANLVFGVVIAILALLTVFSTSMIYTQIRAVPRWHQWLTPVLFLAFALTAGSWFFMKSWTLAAIIVTAIIQILHWWMGDRKRFAPTARNEATGLEGTITPLFPAHTSANYLMKEMVYQIGRKHAFKLRIITLLFGFILPAIFLFAMSWSWPIWILGFASHILGAFTSRWLFFAEAEHSVSLYY